MSGFSKPSSSGGLSWTEVTGTTQAMVLNNGYIANNAGLVTLTLPATCTVGSQFKVLGKGAGLWKIAQNAGQTIHFANANSTTGASGYLQSMQQYDCVSIVTITANTDFVVYSSVGNIAVE